MLRKILLLITLIFGAGYTYQASAIAPIKSQEAIGEEAESIEIELRGNLQTGQAKVTGCIRCPLTLKIDEKTRFFRDGNEISRKEAVSHTGNSGTIIYKHDSTLKIRW